MDEIITATLGLREEKKQRTREAIASTALGLFLEHGFEGVTVSALAKAVGVSQATIFNYFPAKEDLVYERLSDFSSRLISAIAERPEGESAVAAFERFLLGERVNLGTPAERERMVAITRLITSSPTLVARELDSYEHAVLPLAAAIARGSTGADDRFAARAFLSLHRSLVHELRDALVLGHPSSRVAMLIEERTLSGCARLEKAFPE
jgi:AcrR family transcriptional regulator